MDGVRVRVSVSVRDRVRVRVRVRVNDGGISGGGDFRGLQDRQRLLKRHRFLILEMMAVFLAA